VGRKRIHPLKPPRFQYNEGEILIYTGGLYPQYTNQECKVFSRNKRQGEWYEVIFHDEKKLLIGIKTLKKKEEFNESSR
jgi:hypothetical protein